MSTLGCSSIELSSSACAGVEIRISPLAPLTSIRNYASALNGEEEHLETTPAPARRTYTVAEAATLLGISRGQAYMLARTDQLPGAIKLGGRIVVSRPTLDRV